MVEKICFISLGSYPLLTSNENLKYVGGAELKQVIMAKELAKRGYDVSIITYDEPGTKKKEFSELNIIKTFSPSDDLNYFNKIKALWISLKKANSYIYIQSGGTPGFIALYCYLRKKMYIKWLSSDRNVLLKGNENRTPIWIKIALFIDIKLAGLIIVQNQFQKKLIEEKFKKKTILIKNPILIPIKQNYSKIKKTKNVILWVGTLRTIKQPEVFLKLAELFPTYTFQMIGGESDTEPEVYKKIEEGAQKLKNLNFLGYIPHDEIQSYYRDATIIVNTSKAEGFPNTFLEAWINYTPVVSLHVDPDEIICKNNLGFHSKTFKQMIADIQTLLTNEQLREKMVENAIGYIEKQHNINAIVIEFVNIFKRLTVR